MAATTAVAAAAAAAAGAVAAAAAVGAAAAAAAMTAAAVAAMAAAYAADFAAAADSRSAAVSAESAREVFHCSYVGKRLLDPSMGRASHRLPPVAPAEAAAYCGISRRPAITLYVRGGSAPTLGGC